jgi:hypothetical protein
MRQRARHVREQEEAPGAAAAPRARAHEAALLHLQQTAGNRAVTGLVHTLAQPSPAAFDVVRRMRPSDNFVTGATSMPDGSFQAPQFAMGTVQGPDGSWVATPRLTRKHDEGDSECVYLAPGRYPTGTVEAGSGKPVFLEVSGEVSERIRAGEQEHADDIRHARDISLKEAEDVLVGHVVGQAFPAAATKPEAERHVLDRITAGLTHPGLGNDQARWGAIYRMLYEKTALRDRNGWHKFAQAYRTEKDGEVTYQVVDVRTRIGETPPEKLITY